MKQFTFAMAAAAILVSGASHAAPINSAADPALVGAYIQDFEAGPSGNFVSQGFGGGVNISALTSADVGAPTFSVAGDFAGNYNTRDRLHISNFGSQFQALRFDFGSSISALGFLFGASDSSWTLRAYNSANTLLDSLDIAPVFASNAGDFFGLSGLAGASYATLIQNPDGIYANGGVDYVFVDNLAFTAGNNVPEPGSLALIALACLGAAAARRKA